MAGRISAAALAMPGRRSPRERIIIRLIDDPACLVSMEDADITMQKDERSSSYTPWLTSRQH
jgi:hypothetical protein